MRHALLLCLLLAAAGADRAPELLTLTDGRVLTGVYDEAAGTVTLAGGKASVVLAVKPDQIASRKPVPAPAAATAGQPTADPAAPPKAMTPEEKAAALKAFAGATKAHQAEQLEADAAKVDRDAADALADAAKMRTEADRLCLKFALAAKEEQVRMNKDEILATPTRLPKSGTSNASAIAAVAKADQLEKRAAELKTLAAKKRAEAEAARAGR